MGYHTKTFQFKIHINFIILSNIDLIFKVILCPNIIYITLPNEKVKTIQMIH